MKEELQNHVKLCFEKHWKEDPRFHGRSDVKAALEMLKSCGLRVESEVRGRSLEAYFEGYEQAVSDMTCGVKKIE